LLLDNIAYFVRSDANHSCVLPVISDRFVLRVNILKIVLQLYKQGA